LARFRFRCDVARPDATRQSSTLNDVHGSERQWAEGFAAGDRELMERGGYNVEVEMQQPGFVTAG
jgi:hypothetical protein